MSTRFQLWLVAFIGTLAAFPSQVHMAIATPANSMVVGSLTSQPIGHYEFCQLNNKECSVRTRRQNAPAVTEFGWKTIREVNDAVNYSIMPRTDFEMHGKDEVWSYPDIAGDCEDYVLLKRFMLLQRGFSPADLLITVVRKSNNEGHALLTIRTSTGDYVLDNLNDRVKLWTNTPYTYLKRQASFHTGRWVNIENQNSVIASSFRP